MESIDLIWGALILILLLVYLTKKCKNKKVNLIVAATSTFSLLTGFIAVAIIGLITAALIRH